MLLLCRTPLSRRERKTPTLTLTFIKSLLDKREQLQHFFSFLPTRPLWFCWTCPFGSNLLPVSLSTLILWSRSLFGLKNISDKRDDSRSAALYNYRLYAFSKPCKPLDFTTCVWLFACFLKQNILFIIRERRIRLTVLAVDPTEAWWTLADVTYEGVPPEWLADLTCTSVVAGVRMAGPCREQEKKMTKYWGVCLVQQ